MSESEFLEKKMMDLFKSSLAVSVGIPKTLRAQRMAILARDRSLPHVGRKFYHCVMGLFCFSMYGFVLTYPQAVAMLGTVGGTFILLDVLRLRSHRLNHIVVQWFGPLMRRNELKGLSANSYYVLGMFTVLVLFAKPVALLSILYLAFGDPAAAIVGSLYGKRRWFDKKSVEGSLGNFAVCAVVTLLFATFYLGLTPPPALLLAVLGGGIATFAELIPFPIDDNFSLPVIAGLFLTTMNQLAPLL